MSYQETELMETKRDSGHKSVVSFHALVCVLSFLVALFYSNVSAPTYRLVLTIALVAGAVNLAASVSYVLIWRRKFILMGCFSLVTLFYLFDNLRRIAHTLGLL
jgi:hypothetical protein